MNWLVAFRHELLVFNMPTDQPLTHWDTDPRLVRGLAFLRAHAVTLRTRQKLR